MQTTNKTQPMSIKDFFKNIGSTFTVPPVPSAGPGFTERTNTLPNNIGTYQSPTPNMSSTPNMSVAPNMTMVPPPVLGPERPPVSTGGGGTQTPPPGSTGGRTFAGGAVTPPATNQETQALDYSKYTNPETGKPFTPQEYADNVAKKFGGGTVPTYAGNAIDNPNQTAEELMKSGRILNNERNDIAVGETDPMGVASKSGIQYSPAELSAIEKAYSGIYDPAINDVFAKLEKRKKEDEEAKAAKIREEESAREQKNKLEQMAIQHKYNLSQDAANNRAKAEAGVPPTSGDFAATIDLIGNMQSSVYGKKTVPAQLRGLIDNKDYNSAYAIIANSVGDTLTGEVGTKFNNARRDYIALDNMKKSIEKYAAEGGDMGLLKGTEEQIKRKLGVDSGKASELATELWTNFLQYRSDLSGAAFGAAESRDYASVNPTLGKSLDLNISVINGARNALKNKVVSTVDSVVPSAKYIREYAEGAVPGGNAPSAAKYTVGQVINVGGKQYKITGLSDPNDPDVEPI